MSEILELEYRGLNLLDEISAVEVAFDLIHKVIHIYDTNQVVEPEFNFTAKKYQMSDGFYQMAKVLYDKRFIATEKQSAEQWRDAMTWVFYGSKKSIIKYEALTSSEIPKEEALNVENSNYPFYEKYRSRIL